MDPDLVDIADPVATGAVPIGVVELVVPTASGANPTPRFTADVCIVEYFSLVL